MRTPPFLTHASSHARARAPCPTGVVTTSGLKYVEFEDNENFRELFDLNKDPWEIRNVINDSSYAQAAKVCVCVCVALW